MHDATLYCSMDSSCLQTHRSARQASTTKTHCNRFHVPSCITWRCFQKRSDSRHVSIFGYLSFSMLNQQDAATLRAYSSSHHEMPASGFSRRKPFSSRSSSGEPCATLSHDLHRVQHVVPKSHAKYASRKPAIQELLQIFDGARCQPLLASTALLAKSCK